MFIKHVVDFLYLCPPMKCEVNWVFSSLKVLIEFGVNLLNQILAAPFSVVGKALHMISSGILWRCIRVLKFLDGRGGPIVDFNLRHSKLLW